MTILLILEIALTCAIVCNAVFLIAQNLQQMNMPTGIAEHQLVQVVMANVGERSDAQARAQTDLEALRKIPGVTQVALVDKVPFGMSGNNGSIKLKPGQPQPSMNAGLYFGRNLLSTFGVQLIAGRDFRADEFVDLHQAEKGLNEGNPRDLPHVVIITKAMAQRLWPGQSALGKTIYIGADIPLRVIGVLARLTRPDSFQRGAALSFVLPINEIGRETSSYMIRSAPRDRERVLRDAVARLKQIDPNRVVLEQRTYDQVRQDYFQDDRAMASTLVGVCLALLVVTALGIGGLASFWVAQRRRTIGVRRALGATRGDILHYFMTENFLIVGFGIGLGVVLTYGLSLILMQHYALPRLPFFYVPMGAVTLWCIGQLAVLGPATRAAAVPPVVATRSV
ncbi:FtsX-like permease family protein [Oleiagrimonas sp. MCCC 1A03011]|uniref:ABC transporter permease n=1 Tax=Oleiagrimonas sp. MCCC 1A03011 TaxID=1926883 RepID=UPI0031B59804